MKRLHLNLGDIVAYAIVLVALLWTAFPLYWLAITAFKPLEEFMTYPPTFWPSHWTLDNFTEALVRQGGGPAIVDSLIIALGTLVLSMAVGVPAAYSIARYRTGGDDLSFTILSFRFMPPIVPAIAFFLIAIRLGIFDTYLLLILVNSMASIPFVVWIMKGFFEEIPVQIEEAAEVDGASWLQLFRDHVLPLAAPGLVAVSLFCYIFAWNELLFATILTGRSITPFTKIIPGINIGHVEPHWGGIAALGLLVIVPIVMLSWYLQKYIVRTLSYGAIRE
ncbi:MAG TPA: ABC transporter permease [Chloroflexi bacterium]|nr:ABC transporter permease [Chloroflexota bacterium]